MSEEKLPWGFIFGGLAIVIAAMAALGFIAVMVLSDTDDGTDPPTSTKPQATATYLIIGNRPTTTSSPVESPTSRPSDTALPSTHTPTFTFVPPTQLPATSTASPTQTYTPTATLTLTATTTSTATVTATYTPSNTPTITPTLADTLTPTPVPPTHTPPGPTVAYPDGRPVRFYYDDYSFYMWNPGQEQIAVSPLAFEALDSYGISAGPRFSGGTWAQFYFAIEGRNCMAIETTQAPGWLRPDQCIFYNAVVTPQRTSRQVFWVQREGITEFRILWNEEEIARCPVGTGECVVYLP